MNARYLGWGLCLIVYGVAGYVAWRAFNNPSITQDDLLHLLLIDLAATMSVVLSSTAFKNASLYDPYWSVAPPAFLLYWGVQETTVFPNLRTVVVSALLIAWGLRLTYNWLRGWQGIGHEDWRYVNLRKKSGMFFPFVNMFGIQLFPTLLVFVACVPLKFIFVSERQFGVLDVIATVVLAGALVIEAVSDAQLHRFARSAKEGEICRDGLWARSRHPNYLGEWGIWLGLSLFGLAVSAPWIWVVAGPLVMFVLFRFISIPMIEKRHRARRTNYEGYIAETPSFFFRLG